MSVRSWACIPLCTILILTFGLIVGARLWTRRVLQKRFDTEDWLIVLASVITVCLLGGVILAIKEFGYDRSSTDLTYPQLVWASRWLFIAEFTYIVDTALIKIAILLFYLRLADERVSRAFRYTVYACIADILVYKTIYLIVICLSCRPLTARWDRLNPAWTSTHDYTCLDEPLNLLVGSTISATEDLVIALLPGWLFWRLSMPLKRKLALWSLFLTSTCTCIAGLVRSYFVYKAFWTSEDYIHALYWLWMMSAIEVSVGLICSSIPALKPFMAHHKVGLRLENFWRTTLSKAVTAKRLIGSPRPNTEISTNQTSVAMLSAHPRLQSKGGIFDGSTDGGVPTTTSAVTTTWDCTTTLVPNDDALDVSYFMKFESEIPNDEERQIETGTDYMFISVRSSITVDRESRRSSRLGFPFSNLSIVNCG